MIKKRFHLTNFNLEDKKVFLRVDFNVPLKRGKIVNDTKIVKSIATIKFLLKKKCKIIIATHFGRPNGEYKKELSVKFLAKYLSEKLRKKVVFLDDCIGNDIKKKIIESKESLFFLENLRYYKQELNNNLIFSHSLANLANVYVNDAFGVSHRKNSSIVGITKYIPSVMGLNVEEEIRSLNGAIKGDKPRVWIIGGAKLDKVDLILNALKKAEKVLIGGALPFAFMKAQGIEVGESLCDKKSVRIAKKILKNKLSKKLVLPIDFVVSDKISKNGKVKNIFNNEFDEKDIGLDLGKNTIDLFKKHLRGAKTIVWNGPLGYYEIANFSKATFEIARFISKLTATTICGGGETNDVINLLGKNSKMSHVSTGGGASLQFLEGKRMPGLDALYDNHKRFKDKV
jgi:3-phosphoglycerate kinase